MRFHLKIQRLVVLVIGSSLVFVVVVLIKANSSQDSTLNLPDVEDDDSEWSEMKQLAVIKASKNVYEGAIPNNKLIFTDKEKEMQNLFPHQDNKVNNRIEAQLNLMVPVKENKTILLWNDRHVGYLPGNNRFKSDKCKMTNCFLTHDKGKHATADAIIFMDYVPKTFRALAGQPNRDQVRILYQLESPFNAGSFHEIKDLINWTATYRRDSVLPAPYSYFSRAQKPVCLEKRNHAANKTKMAAWFVSNCKTSNNRHNYVAELQKYIDVDVFGACGPLICPKQMERECFDRLGKEYRFYLSFENGNCRDYITEKLFVNALQHDVIPVVMGAPLEDYLQTAPPNSFIHVDQFESPQHLARYLNTVAVNDSLYNSYFKWKDKGSFLNTKLYCRLCAMLNVATQHPMWYEDFQTWWNGPGVCARADGSSADWATWRGKGKHKTHGNSSVVKYGYTRYETVL